MIPDPLPRLLACIDLDAFRRADLPVIPALDACLEDDCLVWLRGGEQTPLERTRVLEWTRSVSPLHRARVVVGRDIPLARVYGLGAHVSFHASSVELARAQLGADVLIGASCHNRSELERAEAAGADYATLSPVWRTASKPDGGRALGEAGFAAHASLTRLPLFALGGVLPERVAAAIQAGAWGVAALSPFVGPDPSRAVRAFRDELSEVFH